MTGLPPRSNRIGWVAALATALAAATLTTLLSGVSWYLEVLIVVLAVATTGAAAARWVRSPALVVGAQVLVVGVLVTWLYALPEAYLGLLPTPESLGRLLSLLGDGVQAIRIEAPPAAATDGLRLLVTLGIAAVAIVTDLLSAGLRQPALAGLPLLTVYCVPTALAPDGLDWYWFIAAAAGFLLLVASDSGTRIARWGKVLSGQGGEQAPMAAAGRRVGALALGAAVLLPSLVPGLSEGLLPGTGSGTGKGPGGRIQVTNPMFSLRNDLAARDDVTVLTYTTDEPTPEPLRIVTVDTFDGNTWGPTTGAIPRQQRADGPLPTAPGLSPTTQTVERTTRITVERMGASAYLPVPYPPVRVDVEGRWLYEADTLNIIGDGVSTAEGMQYTVRHLEVSPEPQQLADAPPPPADVVARWTDLPANLPPVIAATARQIVEGQEGQFRQATALQSFFRSGGGFQYSEQAPNGNGSSAIADFLQRRSGFCIHFASTMAVMARTLGIPARVAVGFLPGEPLDDGGYRISLRDAHAWPELYFSGVGWMRFEPTPATRSGAVPGWAAPLPQADGGLPTPTSTAGGDPGLNPEAAGADAGSADTGGFDLAAALAKVPWRAVAAVAVVLAVLAAPMVTARLVRRRRWRRARSPIDRAEAAWLSVAERISDLGVPWPRSATPRQVEQRLAEGLSEDGVLALHRLARAVEQARYAPAPRFDEGLRLRHDVAAVVAAVADNRPQSYAWRARLMPRSGVDNLRSWLVDSGLRFDEWERRTAARLARWWRRPRVLPGR